MDQEIRGHDPEPTEEERAWMQFDPVSAIARALAVLVIAVSLGGYVAYALESSKTPAPVARSGH